MNPADIHRDGPNEDIEEHCMPEPEPINADLQAHHKRTIEWINQSPSTLSLLYDLSLLPEQVHIGTRDWFKMVLITAHMRAAYMEGREPMKPADQATKSP